MGDIIPHVSHVSPHEVPRDDPPPGSGWPHSTARPATAKCFDQAAESQRRHVNHEDFSRVFSSTVMGGNADLGDGLLLFLTVHQ